MSAIRPTKRQQELLTFIDSFIKEHGYSPSYREIMAGCQYTSVATVSLHVNNLIKRGHIRKRDHSARSLEVVKHDDSDIASSPDDAALHIEWLLQRAHQAIEERRQEEGNDAEADIETLEEAFRILGLEEYAERLRQEQMLAKDDSDE